MAEGLIFHRAYSTGSVETEGGATRIGTPAVRPSLPRHLRLQIERVKQPMLP
jgi:hypothetical protein